MSDTEWSPSDLDMDAEFGDSDLRDEFDAADAALEELDALGIKDPSELT